jgi:hypothetical protein
MMRQATLLTIRASSGVLAAAALMGALRVLSMMSPVNAVATLYDVMATILAPACHG